MISTRCPGSGWTGMRGLCLVPPGPLSPSIREPSLLAVLPPHPPPKSPDGSACVHDGFAFCSLGGGVGSEGATPSAGPRSP